MTKQVAVVFEDDKKLWRLLSKMIKPTAVLDDHDNNNDGRNDDDRQSKDDKRRRL